MAQQQRNGTGSALGAYIIWGLLPVYWKHLGSVPSAELLSWRVGGCALLAWAALFLRRRKPVPLTGRLLLRVCAAALLIGINWGIYLWAVEKERMVEASLGYYINPLINVVLGMIFFSEKLSKIRFAALMLALGGVIIMTIQTGSFPWISLGLALTFGLYGLVTKRFPPEMDSIEALAREMMVLGPPAVLFLVVAALRGQVHFSGSGLAQQALLLGAGVVTLLPLWLFGRGAKTLPLGVLGFLQYVAPTLMLILGVAVYGEPFGWGKALSFVIILTALGLYTWTLLIKAPTPQSPEPQT
ncbi:MAG: EamA family transporter RarD [Spirochaetales bacterium]|nr:EamA family transporter RarD [Spirochaetales bacterium]